MNLSMEEAATLYGIRVDHVEAPPPTAGTIAARKAEHEREVRQRRADLLRRWTWRDAWTADELVRSLGWPGGRVGVLGEVHAAIRDGELHLAADGRYRRGAAPPAVNTPTNHAVHAPPVERPEPLRASACALSDDDTQHGGPVQTTEPKPLPPSAQRILAYLRDHPRLSPDNIARGLKMPRGTVSSGLHLLRNADAVVREEIAHGVVVYSAAPEPTSKPTSLPSIAAASSGDPSPVAVDGPGEQPAGNAPERIGELVQEIRSVPGCGDDDDATSREMTEAHLATVLAAGGMLALALKTGTGGAEALAAWLDARVNGTPPLSDEDRADWQAIHAHVDDGHTEHCAKRLVWGDGECECAIGRLAKAGDRIDELERLWRSAVLRAEAATTAEAIATGMFDAANAAHDALRAGLADALPCADAQDSDDELLAAVRDLRTECSANEDLVEAMCASLGVDSGLPDDTILARLRAVVADAENAPVSADPGPCPDGWADVDGYVYVDPDGNARFLELDGEGPPDDWTGDPEGIVRIQVRLRLPRPAAIRAIDLRGRRVA